MRDKNLDNIHNATMKVLSETGIIFHHDRIIQLLKENGIKIEGKRAYFTEEQVMNWIKKAPSQFMIKSRSGKNDMIIGGDKVEYASSNSGFPIITEIDGTERPAKYKDYIKFLKLVHQTDYFNINGGVMVTPDEINKTNIYPMMLYTTLEYTDKCIFGGMGGKEECEMTMDILGMMFGQEDLQKNTRIMTIVSSATPLQFDNNMLETLIQYVENNQAIIISPAVMGGTTGPITAAGTIVVSNAEALAGVIVSQMVKEGAPVVYGSASSSADMRNGSFCIGAPESAICVEYCAKLAKMYGIPSRGGGTLNDAKTLSIQAGYESMMLLLTAGREKINFVLHSAGSFGGYTSMSFEKFVVDTEMLGMVKRCSEDLKTSENFTAANLIREVGPAGEFLTSIHTLENFKENIFIPDLSIRGAVKGKDADKLYNKRINNKIEELLENYEKPNMDSKIKHKIKKYLKDKGYNTNILS